MLDFGIGALAISPVNMHVSSSCHSGAALYQLPERSRGDCLYAKAENLGSLAKTSAELAVPMHELSMPHRPDVASARVISNLNINM